MRPKEPKTDIETLKAWCHWKRREFAHSPDPDDLDFVKAIEDVISQVGTWKAKAEGLAEATREVQALSEALRTIAALGGASPGDRKHEIAKAALDALHERRVELK